MSQSQPSFMRSILYLLFFVPCVLCRAQDGISIPKDTASVDTKAFAFALVKDVQGNYEKAATVLNWLSSHFNWLATDYQTRTVKEIIVRQGGNCFEMASVYMTLLKDLNINYRPIAEINIHVYSDEREQTSEQKIKESGNRMSVFGRQHNDHRWVEIFNDKTNEWIPADPTMNLIGYDNWLKGRVWFGERNTMNAEFNKEMIVPFAIFVVNKSNKNEMEENRSLFYLSTKLDSLYDHKLSKLPSWTKWIDGIKKLSAAAKNAFEGNENLHNYTGQISELAKIYQSLRQEYLTSEKKNNN